MTVVSATQISDEGSSKVFLERSKWTKKSLKRKVEDLDLIDNDIGICGNSDGSVISYALAIGFLVK